MNFFKTGMRLVSIVNLLAVGALVIANKPDEPLWWFAIIGNLTGYSILAISLALLDWRKGEGWLTTVESET